MSISSPFIRRPVATTLLTIAVTLGGVLGYSRLPVSPLPQIDFPTISVSANLPGASPEVMAAAVATPLEKQLTHIAGVTEMTSRSSLGTANVTLQFDLNRDINAAGRDVQAAINAASAYLPANLPQNPKYRKVNPAEQPVLFISLTSKTVPRPKLYDLASSVFAQKLSQVKGVGQVNVAGSSLPAVRVELNPQPVSRYNVGLDQIGGFLQGANANRPKGEVSNSDLSLPVYATDQLFEAKDYQNLVVVYRNGAPVRLSDLGRVVDGAEDVRNMGLQHGDPAITLSVSRQPNANLIEMVDRIRELMPLFQASLPPGVELNTEIDRTLTIRASVASAQQNMLISIGLVILVVFAFLRSGWATFIPGISVPVSLIATFGVMWLCRYSLDNLSLMALAIATGFVVDDAIVVIENITRHIENGMKPMDAALRGASEIGFTVLSMSISLIAVFIPILLMPGIVGRLFREFAVVLSTAIITSLLLSLTATPMMCSRLLRSKREHGRLYNATEKFYQWILSTYGSALDVVLRYSAPMLAVIALTIGVTVYLYIKIPKGFFPQQDTGYIAGNIVGQQHISYQALVEKTKWFEEQLRNDPDVDRIDAQVGNGNGGGVGNTSNVWLLLKPIGQRKITADQFIARIRPRTSVMPGAQLILTTQQDVTIGARQANAQFQYTLQAPDFATLSLWGPRVLNRLSTLPGLADVSSDQQVSGLSSNVVVDHDTASRLGLTTQAVDSALYDAFGQRQVSTMYKSINQYHVVLVLQQKWWESPDFLNTIYVQTPRGTDVPLSTFAHFTQGITPISLPHAGQFPATTISFNLQQGYSLSDAVEAVNKAEIQIGLPTSVTGHFAGTAQAFQASLSSQPILILTAILVVYIVLGILYESLIHPLTIISTIPSAGLGALIALVLFGTELNIIAMIGIILLIGIVKKNAIIMIDFALAAERSEGLNSRDAIYQACMLRFRPIMMTTSCALLGGLPLALGHAAGSELRRPLGIAIVGGLIVSQMLTLFTTPVVYLALDRLRRRSDRRQFSERPAILIPGGSAEAAD
jgi:multidrug efflux pump